MSTGISFKRAGTEIFMESSRARTAAKHDFFRAVEALHDQLRHFPADDIGEAHRERSRSIFEVEAFEVALRVIKAHFGVRP